MTAKTFPMTETGLENLKLERIALESTKREQAKQRIKRARSFCDFGEDSEYEAALNELAAIEERISTVTYMIQQAVIIEKTNTSTIELGSTLSFQGIPDGDEETYTIVGSEEADPLVGKISHNSPIAKSILGAKVWDEINITTPNGTRRVKITHIT